jgi:hypothetical protein
MKALVVYESMYGNTARVAEAIGHGLAERDVTVTVDGVGSADAEAVEAADLVIVGGPTHAHGLSTESSRGTAMHDADNAFEEPTVGPGLREWLAGLPDGDGRAAAAFDTRIGAPAWLSGSAAKHVAKRLEELGYRSVAGPESFLVTRHNELVDGEVEHAQTWGADVADRMRAAR